MAERLIGLRLDIDMIKAKFDVNGFPTAFYDTNAYDDPSFIPPETIEITRAQWLDFINNSGRRKWVNGEVVTYTPPPADPVFPPLTARQFWQAALAIGVKEEDLIADIANKDSPFYIADDEKRESALINITKATSFTRDFPLLKKMAEVNKIPDAQLDTLWNWAATI